MGSRWEGICSQKTCQLFQINLKTVHDLIFPALRQVAAPCLYFPDAPLPRAFPRVFQQRVVRVNHLVLTVIAADKAGQVERIAQTIAEHNGNWLESRMSRMAGQFAGILRIAVPAESHDELVDALQALGERGIRVLIAESGIEPSCSWKPIAMSLVGNDRPGIVRDITRLLAEQGVNVERLNTDVRPAPMSSEPLFHADALLAVPLTLSLDSLQSRLEALADDLMVELELRPEE